VTMSEGDKEDAPETMEEWLAADHAYDRPRRGEIRRGVVLHIDEEGVMIDVGAKSDGFVPAGDLARLGPEATAEVVVGAEVVARVLNPRDREGRLLLSLYQALSEKDWDRAEQMLQSGDILEGQVIGDNRGGVIVRFGQLRGFVPASHLLQVPRSASTVEREQIFREYVGKTINLKVIEVNRERNRLIMSQRLAQQALRRENMEQLLDELQEGRVIRGKVRALRDFGAFVDVGGADGLVHISEIAWQRLKHPSEVLRVGDEVDAYVLRVDRERKRISLSIKRLLPDPWDLVDDHYYEGQVVAGTVTNVVDFGAFVSLDLGVEGLVHTSEIADPPPANPQDVLRRGDQVVARVLSVDSANQRISLSLVRVDPSEREEVLARLRGENPAAGSSLSQITQPRGEASEMEQPHDEEAES